MRRTSFFTLIIVVALMSSSWLSTSLSTPLLDKPAFRRLASLTSLFLPQASVAQAQALAKTQAHSNSVSRKRDLELSSVRFHKKSSSRGQWRGRVSGSGNVKLYLKLYPLGKPAAQKYIGSVQLEQKDGPILFSFLSDTPSDSRWKWKIIAQRG